MRFLIVFLLFAAAAVAPIQNGGTNTQQSQTTTAAAGGTQAEHTDGGNGNVESRDHKEEGVQDNNWQQHDLTYKVYEPVCTGKTSFANTLLYLDGEFNVVSASSINLVECNTGVDIFSSQNQLLARFAHDAKSLTCATSCSMTTKQPTRKEGSQLVTDGKKPGFNAALVKTAEDRQKLVAFDKEISEKNQYKLPDNLMTERMEELKRAKNKLTVARAAAIVKAGQGTRVVIVRKQGQTEKGQNPGDGDTTKTQHNDGEQQRNEE